MFLKTDSSFQDPVLFLALLCRLFCYVPSCDICQSEILILVLKVFNLLIFKFNTVFDRLPLNFYFRLQIVNCITKCFDWASPVINK